MKLREKSFLVILPILTIMLTLFSTTTHGQVAGNAKAAAYKRQLIEGAKREGAVRIGFGIAERAAVPVIKAFQQEYPFIKDVIFENITGVPPREKVLAETSAGMYNYDAFYLFGDMYPQFIKAGVIADPIDWNGVFGIDRRLISPDGRGVFVGGSVYGIAYNPKVVSKENVPKSWNDCLNPYFKGKVLVDVRPRSFEALYITWGKEKMLDFARKLGAQNPVWMRGQSQGLMLLGAGEYPLACGAYWSSTLVVKDQGADIEFVFAEPVPTRPWASVFPFKNSRNKNAAQLLLGWLATKGEKYLDGDYRGSPLSPGTKANEALKGKTLALIGWEAWGGRPEAEIHESIQKVWGLPTPKIKDKK